MPVINVQHLRETRSIDSLGSVLEDGNVAGRVRLLELRGLVLAFENIHLEVGVVQPGSLAVQEEGAAVGVQAEADYIYLACIDAFECFGPRVSLVFAKSRAHNFLFMI